MLFSSNHGVNVELSENDTTASWLLRCHQGLCITDKPMLKEDIVSFIIQGSGHLAVGFLQDLPHEAIRNGDGRSLQDGVHWHRFRFKKENAVVSLQRADIQTVTVHKGNELVDTVQHKNLTKSSGIWVCLDVLFGDLKIKIDTEISQKQGCGFLMNAHRTISFSQTCASNVEVSENSRCVSLVKPYDGALSVVDHPLRQGEAIIFNIAEMNLTSVAYIKVFLTNIIPVLLTLNGHEDATGRLFPLFSIDVDSNLEVKVQLKGDGRVTYRVMNVKKSATVHGLDLSRPVFVCIQLFQVKVKLIPDHGKRTSDDITEYGSVPTVPFAPKPVHAPSPPIAHPSHDISRPPLRDA